MDNADLDSILPFAYGSNMLEQRMQEREPTSKRVGNAFLPGWKIKLNKLGKDGTAKANIEKQHTIRARMCSKVWGVLYQIPASRLDHLAMRFEPGYSTERIDVYSEGDSRRRPAACFVSEIHIEQERPATWYTDMIVAGAVHAKLPTAYLKELRELIGNSA
jgi:gamma-glutamylcyclotransferase